jgi:hypothetical protein
VVVRLEVGGAIVTVGDTGVAVAGTGLGITVGAEVTVAVSLQATTKLPIINKAKIKLNFFKAIII